MSVQSLLVVLLVFVTLLARSSKGQIVDGYDLARDRSYTINPTGYTEWRYEALNGDFDPVGAAADGDAAFLTTMRYEDMYSMPRVMTFLNTNALLSSDITIVVDLQSAASAQGATILGRCCATGGSRPTALKIHSSNDQSSWTQRASQVLTVISPGVSPIDDYKASVTFTSAAARYWRFTVTMPAGSYVQLTRVQLWC